MRRLASEQTSLTKRSGVIETQVEVVAGRVSGSVARFKAAVEAVTALAAHGLVALEDDALLAARALAAPPASTETLAHLTARVSEQITALRDALSPSRGYVVSQEYPGDDRDLVVVTVASAHGRQRVEELAEQLDSELETLKASISESEQQLMRKWIVDGLADALSVRLAEVREQVERTNRVLARCPRTSASAWGCSGRSRARRRTRCATPWSCSAAGRGCSTPTRRRCSGRGSSS